MNAPLPIAWLQLTHQKLRLLVAALGVAFAVVLICVQLGFQDALYSSAVRYHEALNYDVALLAHQTQVIVFAKGFSRRRLVQVRGMEGVASASALYLGLAPWQNPVAPGQPRSIFVVGFDPSDEAFNLPGIEAQREQLKLPDVALYDALSRPEFGPVPDLLRERGDRQVETEVADRTIEIAGLFRLGTSFGIDAGLVTSDINFLRILPMRSRDQINLGLVRVEPGADVAAVRDAIDARLPQDVRVLTRPQYIEFEMGYWSHHTPIGYVFGFGVIMGLTVGSIIVYQILFSDVSDHLKEYATLKAMGYSNGFLFRVVLSEAIILAGMGFVPGLLASILIYENAGEATRLPLEMTPRLALSVFGMTAGMCTAAGFLALRKIRSADPAEIF